MTTAPGDDREYPVFDARDDDFHDEVLSDSWWETETCWFSWNVPERDMGGWVYCQARPNARLCNGGAWVWDAGASLSWDLPYHVNYSGLRLPARSERDLRDFSWPTGARIKMIEPLQRYEITYDDPGSLQVTLEFDALMPPNPHPFGVAPFLRGVHFDQPGRVRGEIVLHGERITVDCTAGRDRSWGPRPLAPSRRRPSAAVEPRTGTGGVGYSFAAHSSESAWLTYSAPTAESDDVLCGFLLREGTYGHIVGGARRVRVDADTGWPTDIEIEATDELGRTLEVTGTALSRHWKGQASDSLMHWRWDGVDAYGEDQTYLPKPVWMARRAAR